MDDLTDEEKRQAAGKCNFLLITLFCMGAFICGIYSTSYCQFLKQNVGLQEGIDPVEACDSLTTESSFCEVLIGDHGVGFYAWQGTILVNQRVCLSYTQYITGTGYVTPSFDTKFNSAKGLGVAADVFGAFAWFTLLFSSCCPITQSRLKGLSCYFFLATLFQGLTLLIFRSNVCRPGFFQVYFPDDDISTSGVITGVNCSLGTGAKMSISATVLYFICMCLIPGAVAPGPIEYSRAPDREGEGDAEGGAVPTE